MIEIEEKILQEIKEIKKGLQDIRSILEPKKICSVMHDKSKEFFLGLKTMNQVRTELRLQPIEDELFDKKFTAIE